MAFTSEEEAAIRAMLFEEGGQIGELPVATSYEGALIEIASASGESFQANLISAVSTLNKRIAVRRWDERLSTPVGVAVGNIDFLRELPSALGLGCYLVTDDRVRRKLDPTNHYRFSDGSPASLDGTQGQYMWCWNTHYYGFRKEGSYYYEAVSLEPLPEEWESYRIPAGGTSALGAGVIDRDTSTLCSLISEQPRYRGGTNKEDWDGMYNSLLGMPGTGIPYNAFSTYARKRGQGWEANWYVSRAVQEYLTRIILGTRHIQLAFNPERDANGLYQGGLGLGAVAFNYWGAHNNYNPAIKCSAGVELGDAVGISPYAIKSSSGETLYTAPVPVFFGLKNMYGHLWQRVGGLIIDRSDTRLATYVARSLYGWQNQNNTNGMVLASEFYRPEGATSGTERITSVSMSKLCCMPTGIGGSSSTYYGDALTWRIDESARFTPRLAGGDIQNGTNDGAVTCNADESLSVSSGGVSAPLCFFSEDPVME